MYEKDYIHNYGNKNSSTPITSALIKLLIRNLWETNFKTLQAEDGMTQTPQLYKQLCGLGSTIDDESPSSVRYIPYETEKSSAALYSSPYPQQFRQEHIFFVYASTGITSAAFRKSKIKFAKAYKKDITIK